MRIQLYLIGAMILLGLSCNNQPMAPAPELPESDLVQLSEAQLKQVRIETGKCQLREVQGTLKVTGRIDVPPQNMVSVSVPFGGYLKSTDLLPGTHVKRGDVIAEIEDQYYIQLQQEFLTARARYKFLEGEYSRQKELNQFKAASDKVFQQAEADFISHKVLLRSLSEKLRLLYLDPEKLNENNLSRTIRIYSPISGVVSKVNANIGKYIPAAEVLFELINPSDIHLNISVFEKDLEQLYVGQRFEAYTNHHPEKKLGGEIILISSDLKPDRTAEVHCHFDKNPVTLFPGMYMNANIELNRKKVYCLPDEAIVLDNSKKYIFETLGNGRYQMIEIGTGSSADGMTEILESENLLEKKIVTKGAYALLMKLRNTAD